MTRKTAILSAMLALMLTACSTPRIPALDARQVQRFEAQGYPPPQELATEPLDEVRVIADSPGARQGLSPTSAAMQQAAQASVSVAFLDAYVRQDPSARQWLQAQAGHWLAPVGDWLSK